MRDDDSSKHSTPTADRGTLSRRDFLRLGAALATTVGVGQHHARVLAAGLREIFEGRQPVLWLQGMSCSGCSVSFLNTESPGPLDVLTRMISLVYHPTVSATMGAQAIDTARRLIDHGGYYLVVEGSLPLDVPEACVVGGRPLASMLAEAARNADLVVAAGTCAAFGGIPAADGNTTGAASIQQFMEAKRIPIQQRLVNCPGCPVHPQSLTATLAYAAGQGYPEVHPERLTPNMIYAHSVHDDCPRFHYWQKEIFAEKFGDDGCLFKLGCLGPHSHTNCPQRQWNGGVNWCIRAGAPCTACTSSVFALRRDFAFYRFGEKHHAVAYSDAERKGGLQ